MNQSEDRAVQLLRETFADAERLIADDHGSVAVRPPGSRRTPILLAAAAVLAIVAGSLYAANREGPRSEPRPASTVTTTAVQNETVRIYTAVVAAANDLDRPSAGWPKLFVVDAPYEGVGGPGNMPRRGQPFDPAVQVGIETDIRKLAPIEWVSDPEGPLVDKDNCARVKDGGSVITVGPIKRVGGHVEVGVRAYQACQGAHWLTYRLDRGSQGAWRITGIVGQQAIS